MNRIIYFDEKSLILTDEINANADFSGCEKTIIKQAIQALQNQDFVCIYNDDFETLFESFKSCFKYIEAAGGFIRNENDEYLFIFRREKWDLPKGKLEVGETPEIASVREVQEETGLQSVCRKDFRCSTWHTYELRGEQILKQTYWFNMEATKNQESKPQLEEQITQLEWLSKSEFSKVLANTFPSIAFVLKQ